MRPNPICNSWASLMLGIGLAVMCFSQLSEPVLASSAPSDRLLCLASMMAANFSNEEQVRQEATSGQPTLDLFNLVIQPVHVPLFGPGLTFYGEEIINGQVIRRNIAVLREYVSELIDYRIYELIKPLPTGESSWTSDSLQTLTMDDLEYFEGCDATYYEIDDGTFFGEFPNCLNYSPESPKSYPTIFTCNVMGTLIPVDVIEPEKASHVPYQLRPITRYPLLPSSYAGVDNYENPCL